MLKILKIVLSVGSRYNTHCKSKLLKTICPTYSDFIDGKDIKVGTLFFSMNKYPRLYAYTKQQSYSASLYIYNVKLTIPSNYKLKCA